MDMSISICRYMIILLNNTNYKKVDLFKMYILINGNLFYMDFVCAYRFALEHGFIFNYQLSEITFFKDYAMYKSYTTHATTAWCTVTHLGSRTHGGAGGRSWASPPSGSSRTAGWFPGAAQEARGLANHTLTKRSGGSGWVKLTQGVSVGRIHGGLSSTRI